jgi:hypothetical protein
MFDFDVRIKGKPVLTGRIDPELLRGLLGDQAVVTVIPKSTPITSDEAEELLKRVNATSRDFLRKIARNGGRMLWGEMRKLFSIEDQKDTTAYHNGPGKGITRALRAVTGNKKARLLWWTDADWVDEDRYDLAPVYIDGPALDALRVASGE